MTLGQKQELFAKYWGMLIMYAYSCGHALRFGELMRTEAQQRIYFNSGKSKTMNSKHLQKLAGDIAFITKDGKDACREGWRTLGAYWESLDTNNRWGGNFQSFRDEPHFEYNG